MRRVLVMGPGGAGKSTFAARLADHTGLPLIHLDGHYFSTGWVESSKEEWVRTVEEIVTRDRWIMDGDYLGTLHRRLPACDTVIYLDVPRLLCLWRVVKRRIRYHGKTRPDLKEGCDERLTWAFARWIWRYPEDCRPRILRQLAALRADQRVIVLRSASEVERFFRQLPRREGDLAPRPLSPGSCGG